MTKQRTGRSTGQAMQHTIVPDLTNQSAASGERPKEAEDLDLHYQQITDEHRIDWTTGLRLIRKLGAGGQGTVFLAERHGSDGFCIPLAVKIFSPECYRSPDNYDCDMKRLGAIAAKVARIQHDNVVGISHFINRDRVRLMIMEWIDGFDLRRLLTPGMFGRLKERCSARRWSEINQHLVSAGPVQPRLRPSAVRLVLRESLAALGALHDENMIHSDIKPSNMMVKRTGLVKLIDVGSAIEVDDCRPEQQCTPAYAAPEVLAGDPSDESSDLAGLGYLAAELLLGRPLFDDVTEIEELIQRKRNLAERLPQLLEADSTADSELIETVTSMVSCDPEARTACHQSIGSDDDSDLSVTRNYFRIWIEELLDSELDEEGTADNR